MLPMLIAAAVSAAAADGFHETGIDLATPRPAEALQECVVRRMSGWGNVVAIPRADGFAADLSVEAPFGMHYHDAFAFEVHDAGDARHITVRYRHPMSFKSSRNTLKDIGKVCFPELLPLPPADG